MLANIGQHYDEISGIPKPMFNRAVQAPYPPGSVFKLVNGLIGLQEGTLRPEMAYPCSNGYHFGSHTLGCHTHRSPLVLEEAVMMSCNSYFCYVLRNVLENKKYKDIAESLDRWNDYVQSFGFGHKLGSDFPAELGGTLPTSKYYNKVYGKGRWKFTTIISISIGQGEVGVTPLQIANFCATVANRGWYRIPHIIKASEGVKIDPKYYEKQYTMVDTLQFKKVIKGMWRAVNSGYGWEQRRASRPSRDWTSAARPEQRKTPAAQTIPCSSASRRRMIRRSPWPPTSRMPDSERPGRRPSLRFWSRSIFKERSARNGNTWKTGFCKQI